MPMRPTYAQHMTINKFKTKPRKHGIGTVCLRCRLISQLDQRPSWKRKDVDSVTYRSYRRSYTCIFPPKKNLKQIHTSIFRRSRYTCIYCIYLTPITVRCTLVRCNKSYGPSLLKWSRKNVPNLPRNPPLETPWPSEDAALHGNLKGAPQMPPASPPPRKITP